MQIYCLDAPQRYGFQVKLTVFELIGLKITPLMVIMNYKL